MTIDESDARIRLDADTGFYQVRNRYLHPGLGRWLTRDPIG
jgi:RHS repeat-associated protein